MIIRNHKSLYLTELSRRVLIYDGAIGSSIDLYPLTPEDFGGERTNGNRDYLVCTRPDIIREIHTSFLDAGCDVLETNTFQASRIRLEEWGLADRTHELNSTAARLARSLVEKYEAQDGRKRFVAGSIGPTGRLPSSDDPSLSNVTFEQLSDTFYEQASALIEGGVDVLLIETSVDILEVKAALDGVRRAKQALNRDDIAVQAQVFLDISGRMLLGTDISSVMATLEAMQVDVIGLNCSSGPEHMRDAIRYLCQHSRLPISCIPNAGLPIEVNGETIFPMEPEPFARILGEFVADYGVAVVGGCCGSRPPHIAQLRQIVGYYTPQKKRVIEHEPSISSGIRSTTLLQSGTPLIIGERVNTLGSRKVKRLLLNDDYDSVMEVAREQMDGGAHALDVCVAMTERADESEQMRKVLKKLTMNIELPLVIDTTEADVLQVALETYPGRAVVNSISLEGGRGGKIDRFMPLIARYGAATIAMTIDEEGMAHTAERKAAIACRIAQIARDEFGLNNDALLFDVLTFPITTGQEELRRAAIETIEGIRQTKEQVPGCFTVLGVSNLSFGVTPHARAALNSVFLYHAVQAGLDAAIINPSHVTPYADIPVEQREICEDLIFNRQEDALARFIHFYEEHKEDEKDERLDPTADMLVDQRIHWKIAHRKKELIDTDIDIALRERMDKGTARGIAAIDILNSVLLPAMKEVGDKFGAGELILPFVLQSAEVMKKAVAHLEQYLDQQQGTTKGKVVLATVYGDVHDIGKNLVNTILSNNGYTVYDLGKQVPLNTIIEKAIEVKADAIGLSALLVSTSKQMQLCVQELQRRNLAFPVVIGGAAINRPYGQRILFAEPGKPYEAGVFYCKDAFEGLRTVDALVNPATHDQFVAETIQGAYQALSQPKREPILPPSQAQAKHRVRSDVRTDIAIPTPPFWGAKIMTNIRLDDVWPCMDLNTLFRLHWGGKNAKGENYQQLIEKEFMPLLRDLQIDAVKNGWLRPKVACGFFPVQGDGDDLIVYEPTAWAQGQGQLQPRFMQELTRFTFPRQPDRERLCLADYFASIESGRMDLAAFQVVTLGQVASEYIDKLQSEANYSQAYFAHGLSVTAAEGLAEYTNRIVCKTLGLEEPRGRRYSWGYPAIPDLSQHEQVWKILPAEEIGITLTESFQIVPEQSTAAIVVHHPQSSYFAVNASVLSATA